MPPQQVNTIPKTAASNKAAVFYSQASINTDFKHPLQKRIDFVFCDALPNANNQAVPESEFDNVVASSMYTPVKINFDGEGPTGHANAAPIGPITSMQVQDSKVLGSAIIWCAGNEKVIDWMSKASAEEGGVQFSWEIFYSHSETDTNNIEWLHNIVSDGIAIVANPAYEGRTPLLSMAEKQDAQTTKKEGTMKTDTVKTDAVKTNTQSADIQEVKDAAQSATMDDLYAQVQSLTDRMYTMMDALYSALEEVKPQVDVTNIESDFSALLDKLRGMSSKLSEATVKLTESEQELSDLRAFKASTQAKEVLSARRDVMIGAGVTGDAFEKRAEVISGMSDEAFTAYVADITDLLPKPSSSQKAVSTTSAAVVIPDPFHNTGTEEGASITVKDLAKHLKNKARTTKRLEDILVVSS